MPFDLLSQPIRKYIRDKRWEQLRPIQAAAISRILSSDENYILTSRTASGKTEAAFLPILSKVDFNEEGVQVLYISPLIALINDQFLRIEELCGYLEVPVIKWHGESNRSAKKNLLKYPEGIVLITPESIEAMFVNKPYDVNRLFSNLKYVVIDEIHSFIGTDRGIQLKSLLSRLQSINKSRRFNIVGLSATIGDYNEAKRFTGDEVGTKVLVDKTVKEMNVVFKYFENPLPDLSLALLKDIYKETYDGKTLIFPNSRGRAEEIAVKLKKIADRVGGHPYYFSHHSSVDKEVREYVEEFAKNNRRQNFTIACTSTLELGIDIGSVDKVVQVDATHSIASLIQRVGRSGRQGNKPSNLYLYATDKWNLLQSLAAWILYKEGFIEPPEVTDKPYDILLHQLLSVVKEKVGVRYPELLNELKTNFAFNSISEKEIVEITDYLIETEMLEKLGNEIIIGPEGENLVNSRDFYSVFKPEENLKVLNEGTAIGELPFSPQLQEDQNILLAARIWKIIGIDFPARKIMVVKALDGKKPVFGGTFGAVHPMIRLKMLEILKSGALYDFLDDPGQYEINELRKDFSGFGIRDIVHDRPITVKKTILEEERAVEFWSFTGTRVNRTIQLLLNASGIECSMNDKTTLFSAECSKKELEEIIKSNPIMDWNNYIAKLSDIPAFLLNFSKWGQFLPRPYRIKLIRNKYYDIDNTAEFLNGVKLITPRMEY